MNCCWRAVTKVELNNLEFQNFVDMPETDGDEAFLFVTPPPPFSELALLLDERHCLLPKSSIFDSF